MRADLVKAIAEDVRWYASRYRIDLLSSLLEWEGDGPNGSFGLQRDEEEEVARELGILDEWRAS